MENQIIRLVILYPHILACCISIGGIFILDIKLLISKFTLNYYDKILFSQIANITYFCLMILWISGLYLVYFDLDTLTISYLINKQPKLLAKICVVSILTINGIYLHKKIFPQIINNKISQCKNAYIYGGLSISSWLYASFLGIAKPLANVINFTQFILIYIIFTSIIIVLSLFIAKILINNGKYHLIERKLKHFNKHALKMSK